MMASKTCWFDINAEKIKFLEIKCLIEPKMQKINLAIFILFYTVSTPLALSTKQIYIYKHAILLTKFYNLPSIFADATFIQSNCSFDQYVDLYMFDSVCVHIK